MIFRMQMAGDLRSIGFVGYFTYMESINDGCESEGYKPLSGLYSRNY